MASHLLTRLKNLLECPGPVFVRSEDLASVNRLLRRATGRRRRIVVIEGAPTLRATVLLKQLAVGVGLMRRRKVGRIEFDMDLVVERAWEELSQYMNKTFGGTRAPGPLIIVQRVDIVPYDVNIGNVIVGLMRGMGPWRFVMTGASMPQYIDRWIPKESILEDGRFRKSANECPLPDVPEEIRLGLQRLRDQPTAPRLSARAATIQRLLATGKREDAYLQISYLLKESADEAYEVLGPKAGVSLGRQLETLSRFKEARGCYGVVKRALTERSCVDARTTLELELGIAKCEYVDGHLEQAKSLYRDVEEKALKSNDYSIASSARFFRAKLHFYMDDLEYAEALLHSTMSELNNHIRESSIRVANNAYCEFWIGRICSRRKDFCEAEKHFKAAKVCFVDRGCRRGEADLHCEIANCYYQLSNYPGGRENFWKALSIDEDIGYGSIVGHKLNRAIGELRVYGPSDRSIGDLTSVRDDGRATEMNKAAASLWLGRTYEQQGRLGEADTELGRACKMYSDMGMRRHEVQCLLSRLRVMLRQDAPDAGNIGETLQSIEQRVPLLMGNEDLDAEFCLLKARTVWVLGKQARSANPREVGNQLERAEQLMTECDRSLGRMQARVCKAYLDEMMGKMTANQVGRLESLLPCLRSSEGQKRDGGAPPTCVSVVGCLEGLSRLPSGDRYFAADKVAKACNRLRSRAGIGLSLRHEMLFEFLSMCDDIWWEGRQRGYQGILDPLRSRIAKNSDELREVCRWFEKHGVYRPRGRWRWDPVPKSPEKLSSDPESVAGTTFKDDVQILGIVATLSALLSTGRKARRTLRILDAGCGRGRLLSSLTRRFEHETADIEYTGVDVDPTAIEEARAHLQTCLQNLGGGGRNRFRGEFLVGDLRYLQNRFFPPPQFDAAVLCNTTHEIEPRFLPTILTQLCACIRPGGLLVIHDMEAPYIAERRFVPWEAWELTEMLSSVLDLVKGNPHCHYVLWTEGNFYTVELRGVRPSGKDWQSEARRRLFQTVTMLLRRKCEQLEELVRDLESGLRAEASLQLGHGPGSKGKMPTSLTPDSTLDELGRVIRQANHGNPKESVGIVVDRPKLRVTEQDVLLYEKLRTLAWCRDFLRDMSETP